MSKKKFVTILMSFLVFLPVACSFKKDISHPNVSVFKPKLHKYAHEEESNDKPDLFAVISKGNVTNSIEALDKYTTEELDTMKNSDGSVLDAVVKTESEALAFYLLGRGVKPYNFSYAKFVEDGLQLPGSLKRHMGELINKLDNDSKQGIRNVNESNFSKSACIYYVQYHLDILNVQAPFTDASNQFIESASRIFQSEFCRNALESISSDVLSEWGSIELLRQIEFGFSSTKVLDFFDNLNSSFPISLKMPYMGYVTKADPRISLFMDRSDRDDWSTFVDGWWPLLDRHTPKGMKGWVYVNSSETIRTDLAYPKRFYKGFFISDEHFRICLDTSMNSGPQIMEHFGVKEENGFFSH